MFGRLSVSIDSLPDPAVSAIRLRVEQVTAHVAGKGWIELRGTPVDVDLLTLTTPETSTALGWAALPAGTVTQVRLLLTPSTADRGVVDPVNYVVVSGERAPLEVPSGEQSGVKVLGPFTVVPCVQTAVTLELDAHRSLWLHRTGGVDRWILRPVVRVRVSPPEPVMCPDEGSTGAGSGRGGSGGDGSGMGHAGSTCARSAECLSNLCDGQVCAASGAGGACGADTDCASATCVAGTCGPGTAGWTGSQCSVPVECASNDCVDGACQPGGQGAPCRTSADCAASLRCISVDPYGATCQPPSF